MFKSKLLLCLLAFTLTGTGITCAATTHTTKSESTKEYMSDAAITTKVKSKLLATKDIKSLSISVTTNEGIVTLTGNVKTNMQKTKAVKVASKVKGVKSVKDELVVTGKE